MSIPERCLAFSGLYEAELLLQLMLTHWGHPYAADAEFRASLLERAAEVLRMSIGGTRLVDSIPPDQMNFVAAVWYGEWSGLAEESGDDKPQRERWLDAVRRGVPSCFCNHDLLS